MLHNRRVISLHKISEVKRVPVELQQARMILAHLPGFSLLEKAILKSGSKKSIFANIARLAGFAILSSGVGGGEGDSARGDGTGHVEGDPPGEFDVDSSDGRSVGDKREIEHQVERVQKDDAREELRRQQRKIVDARPAARGQWTSHTGDATDAAAHHSSSNPSSRPRSAVSSPVVTPGTPIRPPSVEGEGAGEVHSRGAVTVSGNSGFMGLTALMIAWPGNGVAKFQFVELSGDLCTVWRRHVYELMLAHKLAQSFEDRDSDFPLPVLEQKKAPWLPLFVADNLLRANALESMLGRCVTSLYICSNNANAEAPDAEGGALVRELYSAHWAAQRYSVERDCTDEKFVDIFNFKTLDQNLVKLEELLSGLLDTLRDLDSLTEWKSPLKSAVALGGCVYIFISDSLSLLLPASFLAVTWRMAWVGLKKYAFGPLLHAANAFTETWGGGEGGASEVDEGWAGAGNVEGPRAVEANGEIVRATGAARHTSQGAGASLTRRTLVLSGDYRPGFSRDGHQEDVRVSNGDRPEEGITPPGLRQVVQATSGRRGREGGWDEDFGDSRHSATNDETVPESTASLAGEMSAGQGVVTPVRETADAEDGQRSWLKKIGEQVAYARGLKQNIRKLVFDNIGEVEKQLQVGLQVGRERTHKLSQLQNSIQQLNRVLHKLHILHTWEYPRQSFNYMLLVGACGTLLACTPPRWIFLACVVGKFSPGEHMTKKVIGGPSFRCLSITTARRSCSV